MVHISTHTRFGICHADKCKATPTDTLNAIESIMTDRPGNRMTITLDMDGIQMLVRALQMFESYPFNGTKRNTMSIISERLAIYDRLFAIYERENRPAVVCKDGFRISIQNHPTHHYCTSGETVELGFPSHPLGMEFDDYEDPSGDIYNHVPVDMVLQLVESHGGATEETAPSLELLKF